MTPNPIPAPTSAPGTVPDLLPVLSAGKHRSPRKGACFMEFASYLAGERWSDAPACTHPLLAALARAVNDLTSDAERWRLAPLVPSVIGVTGDDPRLSVVIALRAATTALPVSCAQCQRVMAVSVRAAEAVLDVLAGRPAGTLGERSSAALAAVPLAATWSASFVATNGITVRGFARHGAPATVARAVRGVADAAVADPDAILREMLDGAIADCRAQLLDPVVAPVDDRRWHDAVALTADDRPRLLLPTPVRRRKRS